MPMLTKAVTAAGPVSAAALALTTICSAADKPPDMPMTMLAGKALELQIGDQHAIGYFQPSPEGCSLTVVLADGRPGEGGKEAHGTRFIIPVALGKTARIDGTQSKSAEFVCGTKGEKMDARVFERQTDKSPTP